MGEIIQKRVPEKSSDLFADLSYAEDKLFNMQCYICDAKYAFLEDIGYIYRKMICQFPGSIVRIL